MHDPTRRAPKPKRELLPYLVRVLECCAVRGSRGQWARGVAGNTAPCHGAVAGSIPVASQKEGKTGIPSVTFVELDTRLCGAEKLSCTVTGVLASADSRLLKAAFCAAFSFQCRSKLSVSRNSTPACPRRCPRNQYPCSTPTRTTRRFPGFCFAALRTCCRNR